MSRSATAAKKYNTAILNLFDIILGLNENQQRLLLRLAEHIFIKEKRSSDRKPCHIPIYYATSERVYSSHIINLSPSGLFVVAQKMVPVGEEILMTFRLEGLSKPIKIRGEVAHTNSLGMGVRFKELKPEIESKLRILIAQIKE